MAGNLFILPVMLATDPVNGVPLSGGKLYFYENGTTTPKDTYQDSALTTPHTNPVIADAGGYFPIIWLDGVYSWKLTDSDDVQIDSDDDLAGAVSLNVAAAFSALVTFNGGYVNDPEHATDSGTDAFVSATNTSTPGDGKSITRDFQSANTTTTPTLDGKTLTTRDGSALWAGAVSGVHELQYDSGADTYLVLEPLPIDGNQPASVTYVDAGDPTLDTVVDATNGGADDLTEIDFTGIKSGAKRITVLFEDVSLSGTDQLLVQLGDSGGVEATGYTSGSSGLNAGGSDYGSSTSGFVINVTSAGNIFQGSMVIDLIDGNSWVSRHAGDRSNATVQGGGSKSLSAELDRVRITTSGTDTFDGGNVNILVE